MSDLDDSIETARRLGIEADAEQARQWMLAVSRRSTDSRVVQTEQGVFGDRVALLDFDPDDLALLQRLAPVVRIEPRDGVDSAIAISGSSAQGAVQLFPGDKDFFERVNIRARTREEATAVLRDAMRATALRAFAEPDVVLVEVNLGVYPQAVRERGIDKALGDPITWTPADVETGEVVVETAGGAPLVIRWDEVDVGGGWVYLGWIVADRGAGRISLASNMIDATWEDDHGHVVSLDGAVDPLAQEVYLEADALPLVERLAAQVPAGARDAYRLAMRGEARHYTQEEPSYAKAAKRLYNLFRVADELEAAAYVRELFDEPAARLYQVPGLLEAADVALDPASGIDRAMVLAQLRVVREAIVEGTDGDDERRLLVELADLEEAAERGGERSGDWASELADVRSRATALVNEFFRTRLLAHDRVRAIVADLRQG